MKSKHVFYNLTPFMSSFAIWLTTACTSHEQATPPIQNRQIALAIKLPAMPSSKGASLAAADTLFIPFHLAIRIEGNKNFVFSKIINSSEDLSIEIPPGDLKFKAIYAVEAISQLEYNSNPLGLCKGDKNNDANNNDNYFANTNGSANSNNSSSEYVSNLDFVKNPNNGDLIELNFPALIKTNSKVPYAIKIRGNNLTTSAKIRYHDAWLGETISMPCKDGSRQIMQENITTSMLIGGNIPAIDGLAIAGISIIDGEKHFSIPVILSNKDITKNFYFLDFIATIAQITEAFDADFDNDGISNAAEVAANSNPTVQTTPTPIITSPTGFSATGGHNVATLSWDTLTDATNYAIYYATAPGVKKETATRIVAAAPAYQITQLTADTTYYFNIATIIGDAESPLSSNEKSVFIYPTQLAAPTGLSLSWPYHKGLQLHFTPLAGTASYKAYYKNTPGVTTSDTMLSEVTNGQIINNLNSLDTYYVRISALDTYNQESELSAEVSLRMPEFISLPQNLATYNSIGLNQTKGVYVSGNIIYIATLGGGVSISTNNGETWVTKTVANGLASNSIYGIYASNNIIYAATNAGLSISSDAGITWVNKTTAQGLGHNIIQSVYVAGANIYAATSGGLSISTNGGISWNNKNTTNGLGNNAVYGVYSSANTIYAATYGGLSISTDSGITWINKTTANGLGHNALYGVYSLGNNIYTATNGGGLAISTDNGETWVNKTTDNGLGSNSVFGIYVSGSNIYAATTMGLSLSTNNGETWLNKTSINTNGGLASSSIYSTYAIGSNIYAATYGGGLAISTNNGINFISKKANGIDGNTINDIYAFYNNIYAATNGGGLAISTNGGNAWLSKTAANGLGSNIVNDLYIFGANIYAATTGGLSISTNNGGNWTNKTTAHGLESSTINSICISGNNIYAATQGGLSISTNDGASFINRSTANGLGNIMIQSVYASGNTIYAATKGGLSISTDGGYTFTNKTNTDGLASSDIKRVIVSGNTIYAANTSAGLSISTDSGTSWINKNTTNGFTNMFINNIYVLGTNIYVAGANGLSVSTNNGTTWINKTTANGLNSNTVVSVYAAENSSLEKIIYAGTNSGLSVSGL